MIRIHFTAADLARVTFPAEPEPLWEAALAARALAGGGIAAGSLGDRAGRRTTDRAGRTLTDRALPPVARRWRRQLAPQLRPSMRPLFKLIDPAGRFPDFLTPEVAASGVEPAVQTLMETPAEVVRAELGPWLPAEIDQFMQGLLAGRAGARRALGNAVREFHEHALASASVELERRYGADLAVRSRALLQGGVGTLLAELHPDVVWDEPVLSAHGVTPGREIDVQLAGRGLQLYPSSFTAECLVLDELDRRPVLVYPCADLPTYEIDTDALADLLGRTRAVVLRSLTASASTTQLARRTGISLASASEHARALRNAGLITTHRTAGTAHHSLTPTAHHLLMSPESGAFRGRSSCP